MSEEFETPFQIIEYSTLAAALADLDSRYKGVVYDVTTTAGINEAKKGRAELRSYRTKVEDKRKELKAPALERSRLIDAEAKQITSRLVDLEDPIDSQIKTEEARKEAEKVAKEDAERERVAAIQNRINAINNSLNTTGMTSVEIMARIEKLRALNLDAMVYFELLPTAKAARDYVLTKCVEAYEKKKAEEEESVRLVAERAKLDAEKAEHAARVAAEDKVRAEAEAQTKADQALRDKAEREERDAERRKLDAEREQIATEQRQLKAAQAEEAAKAKRARDLAEAKCETYEESIRAISELVSDMSITDSECRKMVALVCDANLDSKEETPRQEHVAESLREGVIMHSEGP